VALGEAIGDETLEAAGERVGVKRKSGQMTRILSGQIKPGRALASRIERVFGVPVAHWDVEVDVVTTVAVAAAHGRKVA
jgi:hypothetical protein